MFVNLRGLFQLYWCFACFSVVIGLRRDLHDAVWIWVLVICSLTSLYLLLQYPTLLYQGVYRTRKPGPVPPSGQPGGIMRGLFAAVVPAIVVAVVISSVSLYFFLPRVNLGSKPDPEIRIVDVPGEISPFGFERDRPSGNGGGGNNSNAKPNNGGISGMSDGVTLGEFGKIKLDDTVALVVEELRPQPNPPTIYMRAFTFATFDGERWLALNDNAHYVEKVPLGERRELPDEDHGASFGEKFKTFLVTPEKASFGMDGQIPLPMYSVYLYDYPDALTYDWMQDTLTTTYLEEPHSYVVTSNMPEISGRDMIRVLGKRGPGTMFLQEYVQVPQDLRKLIKEKFNHFDFFETRIRTRGVHTVCVDLVKMFKTSLKLNSQERAWNYSLERRPYPGKDAIARFLDTTTLGERFGHCEYFASAMVMLLRSYGIPSRVATGYVGQKQVEEGRWELKGKNAHAWVEVYYEGVGWVKYDPTPSDPNPDSEAETITPEAEEAEPEPEEEDPEAIEPDVKEADDWFNEYDEDSQKELFSGITDWVDGTSARLNISLSGVMSWMPIKAHALTKLIVFFLPVGLILLIVGTFRRRKKTRVRRVLEEMGITEESQKQRGLYVELLLMLSKHGFQKRRSETPREFAERVAATSEVHSPLLILTELYYSYRFGTSHDSEKQFKQSLSSYAGALRSLPS